MARRRRVMTPNVTHGWSGYDNYGCRCQVCRDGWAAYVSAYRQRRKARTGERILHGKFVSND